MVLLENVRDTVEFKMSKEPDYFQLNYYGLVINANNHDESDKYWVTVTQLVHLLEKDSSTLYYRIRRELKKQYSQYDINDLGSPFRRVLVKLPAAFGNTDPAKRLQHTNTLTLVSAYKALEWLARERLGVFVSVEFRGVPLTLQGYIMYSMGLIDEADKITHNDLLVA